METSDLDITDYSQPDLLISGHLNIQESNKLRELFGKHFTNMRLSQKKHWNEIRPAQGKQEACLISIPSN